MQKEAVVVILDVGKSLRENVGSGEFQNALTAVSLLVRDKLVEKPGKVLISLIFMGTKASNNSLHENGDDEGGASKGYEHISVVYDMAPPNVELAKFISNSTPQELLNEIGGSSGDFVDSLVIALDMLSVRAEDKAYSKKIFLITDAGSNADFQLLDPIIEKFTNLGCSLNGIGIGFGGEERVESDDKIQEYIKDGSMSVQELSLAAQIEGKKSGISAVKATNRAIIRYIVHRIQLGAIFSLPQALEMLRFLHPPSVLQRTIFRGLFEIAPGLSIPVYTYKKCHRVNIPTLKKVVTSGDIDRAGEKEEEEEKKKRLPVAERKVVYRLQNDLTIEVEADRTIKGFKYGRSLIPESSIDAEAMKPRTERCLVLIGFTEAYKVQRQSFMGESDVVMAAPSDPCAYSALSAFVAAMAELDRYAICRYISRKSAQPALVALIPHVGKSGNFMWMVSLPFAEDLRNYPFPPLASSDPRTKKSFCPTSDQSAAARELIQALDLDDRLDLKETRNPTLQVFYDAVSYRALHPDASLPSPDPLVTASLVPDPLLFAKAAPELSRFREAFPTDRNRAFEKASAEKGFWRDLIDDDTRDITLDSYMKKSESGDEDSPPDPKKLRQIDSAELELYATVDEVGSVTPASDFEQMLKRRDGDFVLVAISQLCERVTRYVEDSLGSQYYEKAADCVRALRRGCVQEDEPTSFNKFLDTLRKSYEFGPRSEFWSILSRDKLGPISSGESLYSEVTSSQSQHYFEPIDLNSPLPQVESPSPAPHDSVIDDLLDMAE